jgi:hypothetical protein
MIKKIGNHDKAKTKTNKSCSCDTNQTRLKNESVVVVVKPTGSCNIIFDCACRCEIKNGPQKNILLLELRIQQKRTYNCHHGIDFI